MHQLDVKTAYLNGTLKERVFMELPVGFESASGGSKVCRLNKTIYGLKQSGREWYETIHAELERIGLKRTSADHGIYTGNIQGDRVLLALYVDDIIIATKRLSILNKVKGQLMARFKMSDMGEAESILGIRIKRDRQHKRLTLDQTKYINDILERFHMGNCKSTSIPLDPKTKVSTENCPTSDEAKREMQLIPYREAVGSLIYVAMGTRPDLAFAVGLLSRFMSKIPGKAHWEALKRILRYLQGSKQGTLSFNGNEDVTLRGYSDSSWADDPDNRRSTTGLHVHHGWCTSGLGAIGKLQ